CLISWTSDAPPTAAADPRTDLPQALEMALRAMIAESPLLILLDQATAADPASIALLRGLLRDTRLPFGVALALQRGLAQLHPAGDAALIELWHEAGRRRAGLLKMAPLTSEQVETLVCIVLEGADLPDNFPEMIASASGGNPL